MDKIKKTDTTPAGPFEFEPEQREELDKLIDSLKKEIIHPKAKKDRGSVLFEALNQ